MSEGVEGEEGPQYIVFMGLWRALLSTVNLSLKRKFSLLQAREQSICGERSGATCLQP
jgi:hypothetical protein